MLFLAPNVTFKACALLMLSLFFCASTFAAPIPQSPQSPQTPQAQPTPQAPQTPISPSQNSAAPTPESPAQSSSQTGYSSNNAHSHLASDDTSKLDPQAQQSVRVKVEFTGDEKYLKDDKAIHHLESFLKVVKEDVKRVVTGLVNKEYEIPNGAKWHATEETVEGLDSSKIKACSTEQQFKFNIQVERGTRKTGTGSSKGGPYPVDMQLVHTHSEHNHDTKKHTHFWAYTSTVKDKEGDVVYEKTTVPKDAGNASGTGATNTGAGSPLTGDHVPSPNGAGPESPNSPAPTGASAQTPTGVTSAVASTKT
ncbi:hypothetical protein EV361DRAFT_949143 [Lentinula raphanica]|uniref:Uncharacterized protein n=1 Tax=Lentinula raphanica TaxID=153919 RepID=A0AA38UIR6_9AGAR|nr:hypothetical protein F5878DRAFT_394870 [Lentinula raphanica]KAJ3972072.1 hypothetical protein EV361DRAFT_949143 [Lentinula raphanica]